MAGILCVLHSGGATFVQKKSKFSIVPYCNEIKYDMMIQIQNEGILMTMGKMRMRNECVMLK